MALRIRTNPETKKMETEVQSQVALERKSAIQELKEKGPPSLNVVSTVGDPNESSERLIPVESKTKYDVKGKTATVKTGAPTIGTDFLNPLSPEETQLREQERLQRQVARRAGVLPTQENVEQLARDQAELERVDPLSIAMPETSKKAGASYENDAQGIAMARWDRFSNLFGIDPVTGEIIPEGLKQNPIDPSDISQGLPGAKVQSAYLTELETKEVQRGLGITPEGEQAPDMPPDWTEEQKREFAEERMKRATRTDKEGNVTELQRFEYGTTRLDTTEEMWADKETIDAYAEMGVKFLNPLSTRAILLNPAGLNAGVFHKGRTVVRPHFSRVAAAATEKWIHKNQHKAGNIEEVQAAADPISMFDKAAAEMTGEKDLAGDSFVGKPMGRTQGANQLGREVAKAWWRELNVRQGRPSDDYNMNALTNDQYTTLGVLMKEMYHAANPLLYERHTNGLNQDSNAAEFVLTKEGARAIEATIKSAPDAFLNQEIPPLTIPRTLAELLGQGESKNILKKKTTAIVDRTIEEVEISRANMGSVAHRVDPLREKLFFQLAIEALLGMKTLNAPSQVGDFFRLGPAKLAEYRGEENKQRLYQEIQLDNNPEALARAPKEIIKNADGTTTERLKIDYNASFEMEKQNLKFLEVLNTVAKYRGKANYLDFVLQELQTRMHVAQTRFNPQLIPWIRYITGGVKPAVVDPHSNTNPTKAFKELIVTLFFDKEKDRYGKTLGEGDKLLPEHRVALFDSEWNQPDHGRLKFLVEAGNQVKGSLIDDDGMKQLAEQSKQIQLKNNRVTAPLNVSSVPQLKVPDFIKQRAKDKDLEALHMVEAIHELASYKTAWDNKTKFSSNIGVEVDGKTHGPASYLMSLGALPAAYRVGVLRRVGATKNLDKVPQRVLKNWDAQDDVERDALIKDLYQGEETEDDAIAGDIRKGMAEYMLINGQAAAANFMRSKGLENENTGKLYDIVQLAIEDRENFLKKPPMTLSYGQLIDNIKESIKDAVFTGPTANRISEILYDPKFGEAIDKVRLKDRETGEWSERREETVVRFLHTLLADSIDGVLDPSVLAMGQLLRSNNVVAMMTDQVMKTKNAIGVDNYIGAKTNILKPGAGMVKMYTPKKNRKTGVYDLLPPKKTRGQIPSNIGEVQLWKQVPSGSALRAMDTDEGIVYVPGGYGRGQVIPAVIQGIDGAWMNMMFRDSWSELKNEYMLPIMDAVKTDLNGLHKVREHANKNWWKVIRKHSYVNSLMNDWTPKTIDKFRDKLKNLGGDTDIELWDNKLLDNEWRGFFWMFHEVAPDAPEFRKGTDLGPKFTRSTKNIERLFFDTFKTKVTRVPSVYYKASDKEVKDGIKQVGDLKRAGETISKYKRRVKDEVSNAIDKLFPDGGEKYFRTIEDNNGKPKTVISVRHIEEIFEKVIGKDGLDLLARNKQAMQVVERRKQNLIDIVRALGLDIYQIDIG